MRYDPRTLDMVSQYTLDMWVRIPEWMKDAISLNPSYTSWGPTEDHMSGAGRAPGWDSPRFYNGWDVGEVSLDELNEVVNFYFESYRDEEGGEYVGDEMLRLVLWVLHPRKGASRGVAFDNIRESDMLEVLSFLKQAAQRNADRFAKAVARVRTNPDTGSKQSWSS